jgi:recombination protein RecA
VRSPYEIRVPRKIEDFLGAEGVRLINYLSCFLLVLVGWLCYDAIKTNMTTEKGKALELAISQIEKRFGKGAIMKLGETPASPVEAIPSGSLALDLALGVGGIPRGRVTEIFGPEASGKTTLAQHILAEAQKLGGVAAYIDAEHALDPPYAANCGLNVDELLISQPDTGEQALEITEALVRSGAVDVIAIDSVAALVPQAEIEGEMGDAHVGLQARLMSQALRKLAAAIGKSGTAVVFINQLREKVGIVFGNPEVTPGGRALKFYSSIRIDLRRVDSISQGDKIIGSVIRAKVVKNKVAPPFKIAQFDIMFDHGISKEGNLIDLGVELGIVKKTGAFFSYGDIRLGQGRENAKQYLRQNPELAREIEQQVRASAITTSNR